jgi:Undecaprenyl-phosphate glucose phosphotransferase
MAIGYSKYLNIIYAIGDVLALNMAIFLSRFLITRAPGTSTETDLIQILFLNLVWLFIIFLFRIHDIDRSKRTEEVLTSLARSVLVYALLVAALNYGLEKYIKPIDNFLFVMVLFSALLILWRMMSIGIFKFVRLRGLNYRRVLIAGNGPLAVGIYRFFNDHPELGYRFMGAFYDNHDFDQLPRQGAISDINEFAVSNSIDEIYCSSATLQPEQIASLVKFCDSHLIRFKLIPDLRGLLSRRVNINFYDNVPVISLRNEPLESLFNRMVKRAFDVLFSLVIIICIMSWLLPLLALLIKITSPGPVFFRQKRSGLKNVEFTCLKLRTMKVNNEADERQATKDDPRITAIGKWLRRTNLDELPQFFNVFMGQMSVVGPRPHMIRHTEEYSRMFDQFMVRHLIKPGITGWAQVNGYRGETVNPERMRKRVEHDVWYIENWSLMLDLKIIFLTVVKMIVGDKNAI